MSDWPTIPVTAPKGGGPPLKGEVLDVVDEATAAELEAWYRATLVPQLACVTTGLFPALPTANFITQQSAVVVRRDGELVGAWILKDGDEILYPCAVLDDVAGIFRALWRATVEARDYVWGSTTNPVIMAFAQAALQKVRWWGSPDVNDKRIEWRRPGGPRSSP